MVATAARTLLVAAAIFLTAVPVWAQDFGEPPVEVAQADEEDVLARNSGARYDPRQEPAEGPAYQYRQMVLALVVMAVMIAVLVWLVRRQSRARR